ncbi:MAG: nucleoside triphosphate pyrophosphohydrolase [Bacilli bacterium]|nr:nucleoside triphosphate pyrophosphohydrolase [Bacilli bacterium]
MEEIHNKLVRDKIAEIIKNNGENPIIEILNEDRYKEELEKKLYEECNEVINSSGVNRLEELGDLLEVIRALAKIEDKELEDIIKIAEEKVKRRGAFNNRIYLKKVINDK